MRVIINNVPKKMRAVVERKGAHLNPKKYQI